jgi:hypothetical protein
MKQNTEITEDRKREQVMHMCRSRTVCTSLYVVKLSKNISAQIVDISFPFLKILLTLMPVLLVTEKDEITGYYHTQFLFSTNNLAHNMKNDVRLLQFHPKRDVFLLI